METIFFKLFCDIGLSIDLNFISFRPYEILLYLLYIISIYIIITKTKLSKKQMIILLVLIALIILNNILLILNPLNYKTVCLPYLWYDYFINNIGVSPSFNRYVVIYDGYFILFFLTLFAIFNYFTKKEIKEMFKKFIDISFKILLVIILAEVVIKLIYGETIFYQIRDSLFGVGADTSSILERGNLITIYGLCTEPSSLALSLFYLSLGILVSDKNLINILKKYCVIFIIGFFTGSMLFYLLFVLLLFALLCRHIRHIIELYNKYKNIFLSIFIILSLCIVVFLISNTGHYYIMRLVNIVNILLEGKMDFNSETVRIYSSIEMIKIFFMRPLFGAGLGTTYGFSSLFSLLSNFGLIGIIVYMMGIKISLVNVNIKKIYYILLVLLVSFMVHGSINTFVFPQAIYIVMLILYANEPEVYADDKEVCYE